MTEDLIDRLNDLIQLDIDAVGAYGQAIDACDVPKIKAKLTEFQGDHERHIHDLSSFVRGVGGTPKTERDVKGFLIEGFTAIASRGDKSALMAMRGNEELTVRTYRSALDATLTPEARTVVMKNYADEQRHLEWIMAALDARLYSDTGKAA